jgi:hypothetical protein
MLKGDLWIPSRTLLLVLTVACDMTVSARNPQPDERRAILSSLSRLTAAANARDAAAVQLVTIDRFLAYGESWLFNRRGYARWAERFDDLTGVEIATLTRVIELVTEDVAITSGFFRTLNKKEGDLAGDFHCTLLKRDNQWLVASVHFAPSRFEPPYRHQPKAHPSSKPTGQWTTLFDGKSLDAFTSMDGSPPAGVWTIEGGSTLRLTPQQGVDRGLRTRDTFRSFELEWEWKLEAKGNSGLKYLNFYLTRGDAAGHEYQMADDEGDPGAKRNPFERSGALYEQVPPSKSVVRPVGEFNQSRILVRDRHAEHWLNGEKVVEYELSSSPFDSPIVLQHHGQNGWFRNIRIRRLD